MPSYLVRAMPEGAWRSGGEGHCAIDAALVRLRA